MRSEPFCRSPTRWHTFRGAVLLLAFLVYLAFQLGFKAVTDGQLRLYVVAVVCLALSVGGWIAWLSCRRLLERRGPTGQVTRWTTRWAVSGWCCDVATGHVGAVIATGIVAAGTLVCWIVLPVPVRRRRVPPR